MKTALGVVCALLIALLVSLAAIPIAIGTALQATLSADAASCGPPPVEIEDDDHGSPADTSVATPDTSAGPDEAVQCPPADGGGGVPGDGGVVPGDGDQVVVSSCGSTFTVHRSIGENVRALLDAACADGIRLGGWGWRSAARQVELRRAHCGPTPYDIWERPSRECRPPTARPGNSMHERGLAIFTHRGASLTRSSPAYRWLVLHAATHGLHNLPSEPWHWSTNGR